MGALAAGGGEADPSLPAAAADGRPQDTGRLPPQPLHPGARTDARRGRTGGPLRRSASLLEVGEGSGSGEEDGGSGSADAEGGSGSGSGSGGGSGSAAAAAAVSAAAKDMQKSLKSSEDLVKDLKSVHQNGALNNRELTRQIKVLADTLNPPKKNDSAPAEAESDPNKCMHRSCAECVMDKECGWCITKKECVHGDKNHPFSAVCVDWTFDACPCASPLPLQRAPQRRPRPLPHARPCPTPASRV